MNPVPGRIGRYGLPNIPVAAISLPRMQLTGGGVQQESVRAGGNTPHLLARADVDVQPVAVIPQVVHDLVPGGIPIGVAREPQARQPAEPGRGKRS